VWSARYAGPDATSDEANNAKLLASWPACLMSPQRAYRCVIAFVRERG
jgi:inosine/xanthosine triphosphate pyrophosphatase family protein